MHAIFISYRRDDTEGQAGRLFQDLRSAFGAEMVFMDVTAIEPGLDFRKAIEKNTAACGVLLALVGRNWIAAVDEKGARRLDNANDFVRLEIASALRRDIPVIPVLVHGARMPREDELPEDLRDLAFRNGVELTHARWDSDVQVLIKALRPHVEQAARSSAAGGSRSPSIEQAPAPVPAPASEPAPALRPQPGPGKWKLPVLGLAAALVLGGGWAGYGSWQDARQRQEAAQDKTLAGKQPAEKAEADRASDKRREVKQRPSDSSSQAITGRPVALINAQTGKCLTIAGGRSTSNNVTALQYDCDNDPSRSWTVSASGPGTYKISNVQTGKCLTIAGGRSTDNNVDALQFDCDMDPSRTWRITESGGGAFQISNVQTGKCLTIAGGRSADNNVKALQYDCDGDLSRTWRIRPV